MDTFVDPIFRSKSFLKNKITIKESNFPYEFDIFVLVNWFINSLNGDLKKGRIYENSLSYDLLNPITNIKFSPDAKRQFFKYLKSININIPDEKSCTVKKLLEKLNRFMDNREKQNDFIESKITDITHTLNNSQSVETRKHKKSINDIFNFINSI